MGLVDLPSGQVTQVIIISRPIPPIVLQAARLEVMRKFRQSDEKMAEAWDEIFANVCKSKN